ncbi:MULTISPECIES: photosystem II reaction center protein Ycf12 [Spirulina sp. CCY15215]|uniref:photosystem II reaction center protein Ycf12/Psb30 n=1 Tax=Spirulina sp. CCY15215 TaxID=2767591 RepID=UPI00194F57F6|nr:photosystem II reaction center protein Ycf12 [Spirulina major]
MDILTGILTSVTSIFASVNFEVIFQLLFVGLILISGPAVIFLLALNKGDL